MVALSLVSANASTADAEILDIPGGAFRSIFNDPIFGPVLSVNPLSQYYAEVVFNGSGYVCGLSMVYQDASVEADLRATLIRGVLPIGRPFTGLPEIEMASLVSSGASQNVKRLTTNKIIEPQIKSVSSVYHITVTAGEHEDGPWFNFPQLLAVQIDWRYPRCPQFP